MTEKIIKKVFSNRRLAAVVITCFLLVFCLFIYTVKEKRDYEIALGYLRILGITEKDLEGYSKKEIVKEASRHGKGLQSDMVDKLLSEQEDETLDEE